MPNLSKSKLMAYRQCPKRLWLEIHQPSLKQDSAATQASYAVGNQVGDIARQLYDPAGKGQLIDAQAEGYDAAFAQTAELLEGARPIFEAGFTASGALAFADVMLPVRKGGQRVWRMIEVKSSTSVKDYYRDDVAIQAYVARKASVPLIGIALAHIDSTWVYPGGDNYEGLLVENDLTTEAFARAAEVKAWIAEAQAIANKRNEPKIATGGHCNTPYECGFIAHCQSNEPQAKFSVTWLPRIQTSALKALIATKGVTEMGDVPDSLLNERQRCVKTHTLSNQVYFDATGAAADLAPHKLPAYFIDFETINFAVPIWKGTRPYEQIPFQFSVHRLARNETLEHQSFLDLSGKNPSKAFAEALVSACGVSGPVFVYNASFEKPRIKALAERFPRLKQSLLAINERVVDLLKIAEQRYYHPSQQGSWSIKKVLPAIAPDLCYDDLDGVQDGEMAMTAFQEAISPDTAMARKAHIKQQLLAYCRLDTYAMVRMWRVFAGRDDIQIWSLNSYKATNI
ncbi:MAG: DUF2779 domain-containing protein [Rhodocyclaceae bacterium]|nr:DUF2779 domain-containing protein [Rhodocyclaceae bacterium]MBP6278192.1 DUF2779 domain-containing protein [Rhodocyclaceae bacterium]